MSLTVKSLQLAALQKKQNSKWLTFPPDVIGAGIAEMDFALAAPIRERLKDMLDYERFGYPLRDARGPMAEITRSFARRMERKFGWKTDPADSAICVDLLQAITACCVAYSDPGDGVLIQTPCYPAFLGVLQQSGRQLCDLPLLVSGDGFIADPDPAGTLRRNGQMPRILLLCQPHNPTGRCLTREELAPYIELAEAQDMIIVSDEIHADLVYAPHRHQPLAVMFPQAAARIVTIYSATKSYNTPGLRCGVIHFGSPALHARFRARVPELLLALPSVSAMIATLAAWEECDDWLDSLIGQLDTQRIRLVSALRTADTRLVCHIPEATYFIWLDCSMLCLPEAPAKFFLEQARVGVGDGTQFGPGWRDYVRINFATSSELIDEICDRMVTALDTFNKAASA